MKTSEAEGQAHSGCAFLHAALAARTDAPIDALAATFSRAPPPCLFIRMSRRPRRLREDRRAVLLGLGVHRAGCDPPVDYGDFVQEPPCPLASAF